MKSEKLEKYFHLATYLSYLSQRSTLQKQLSHSFAKNDRGFPFTYTIQYCCQKLPAASLSLSPLCMFMWSSDKGALLRYRQNGGRYNISYFIPGSGLREIKLGDSCMGEVGNGRGGGGSESCFVENKRELSCTYSQFNYDAPLTEEHKIFNCYPSRFWYHTKRQNNTSINSKSEHPLGQPLGFCTYFQPGSWGFVPSELPGPIIKY